MVLSDRDIRKALCTGDLVVDPLDDNRVQPASIDLTLDDEVLVPSLQGQGVWGEVPSIPIDLADVSRTMELDPLLKLKISRRILQCREFILGSTAERVEIPDNMVARVEGKSSLGRLGLIVHATAGYIDPGFKGKITLEIFNLNSRPIILHAGKAICQLSFLWLSSPAMYPYGHEKVKSRYQNQTAVTASRYDDPPLT